MVTRNNLVVGTLTKNIYSRYEYKKVVVTEKKNVSRVRETKRKRLRY